MKQIIVEVSPDGEITIETRGFKGPACLKESKFLKDLLGQGAVTAADSCLLPGGEEENKKVSAIFAEKGETMESENVFKKACLIQLTTSNWQGTRMLDQGIMEKLGKSSEWLRGRKYLINPELLGPIHTSTHQARNLVQQYSLPFPITSIYLIPKESLSLVDERLNLHKEKFHQKVEEFIGIYDQAREEAKEFLRESLQRNGLSGGYPVEIPVRVEVPDPGASPEREHSFP